MRANEEKMKRCFRCLELKPLSEFYLHPQMADGHLGKCKPCACRDVRLNRQVTDAPRVSDRRRYRENVVRRKQIMAAAVRRRRENRVKSYAQNVVATAVRRGFLVKPSRCPRCGSAGRIVGHHEDYLKPLDVLWMCVRCHARLHWAKVNHPVPTGDTRDA